jgi:hypothetical protein
MTADGRKVGIAIWTGWLSRPARPLGWGHSARSSGSVMWKLLPSPMLLVTLTVP